MTSHEGSTTQPSHHVPERKQTSLGLGKHMRNGWKNAGLPWGYDFHPDLMWVEPQA
jgi:hypothetical protein